MGRGQTNGIKFLKILREKNKQTNKQNIINIVNKCTCMSELTSGFIILQKMQKTEVKIKKTHKINPCIILNFF